MPEIGNLSFAILEIFEDLIFSFSNKNNKSKITVNHKKSIDSKINEFDSLKLKDVNLLS